MPDLSRFVRPAEACKETGLSPYVLDRRLIAAGVPIFRDPIDRRHRLIRRDDLDELVGIIPFERRQARSTEQMAS